MPSTRKSGHQPQLLYEPPSGYDDDGSVGDAVSIQDVVVVPRGSVVNKYKAGGNIARSKTVIVSSYPDSGSYKSWGWWPDFLVDGNYA
ncbi:MAG: hypothetical protein J6V14_03045, partial [Clostridia bacterium]|nr:hypothetical protein [Clostridia bacterium]